ncbi:carbonic anhydrase [Schizophyllum commune]
MASFPPLARLLSANAQWAADVEQVEPGFFAECAKGQTPRVLWIGCADSRVPESVVTAARPGDIFVHRNIAKYVVLLPAGGSHPDAPRLPPFSPPLRTRSQFHPDDISAHAVLSYAVDHLGVEHVVVVGHSECGGATACLNASVQLLEDDARTPCCDPSQPAEAPLNRWLAPLTKLAAELKLSSAPRDEALDALVEENVKAQVENIIQSQTIQKAWQNGKSPRGKEVWVHGWVFDLSIGKLKDLEISQGPKGAILDLHA